MQKLFERAKPVWLKGLENEKHIRAIFRTVLSFGNKSHGMVKIATSGVYNLYVNGIFAAYGPARAGEKQYRMDTIDITPFVEAGKNIICLEVAGYNVNSYCMLNQPSFLQAEVCDGSDVVSATGMDGLVAGINPYALRRLQRFSFQRPMVEAYQLSPGYDNWLSDPRCNISPHPQETTEEKTIIPRLAPYPAYEAIAAEPFLNGTILPGLSSVIPYRDRSYTRINKKLRGFTPKELELHVTDEIQRMRFVPDETFHRGSILERNRFCLYVFPHNATGMVTANILCEEDTELYFVFDEVLYHNDISIPRSGCANTVKYSLKKGSYQLRFFEVYTMKYLKLCCVGGRINVSRVGMTQYKHPPVSCRLPVADNDLQIQKIADAAIETFRQNAVDIFMDCPSRERAGWLCDSFFTARVERLLTGESSIEKSYLENFLHAQTYRDIPEGMLPMCYPADHYDGNFIVNWAQWLVLELYEYLQRSGDRSLIDRFHQKVYHLLDYLKAQENSDGLLEKLKGWVFVEWSKANELTQDVNYPSNMLYSAALRTAGILYDDKALIKRAGEVRNEVIRQSFTGEFFTDNAVRKFGALVNTNESTEVCQYYAFFFGIATPDTHPKLWNTLLFDFGPARKQKNKYPAVYFANAFIGNYLRLDVMMRYGYKKEVLENIRGYFLYMAEKTGTLWENDSDHASCNHGFASHVLYWLAGM